MRATLHADKTKQTTKKKNADIQERAKWRWEFLRRGEVYIRAYERFKHKYQGWILCGLDPSWLATESLRLGEDPRVATRGSLVSKASDDLSASALIGQLTQPILRLRILRS